MFHSGDFFFFVTISCLVSLFLWIFSLCFCLAASAATYKGYTDVYITLSIATKQMQSSTARVSYYIIILSGSFASEKKKEKKRLRPYLRAGGVFLIGEIILQSVTQDLGKQYV